MRSPSLRPPRLAATSKHAYTTSTVSSGERVEQCPPGLRLARRPAVDPAVVRDVGGLDGGAFEQLRNHRIWARIVRSLILSSRASRNALERISDSAWSPSKGRKTSERSRAATMH